MNALSEETQAWMAQWLEAWNNHDLDALTELVTDDIVWSDPAMFGEIVHGRSEFRAFTETFFCAFPDVRIDATEVLYLATEGERLAAPWRMTGTFTGELALWGRKFGTNPSSFAPTCRRFEIEGVDLYELRVGLLAHWTIVYDLFEFSRQLGLIPPANSRLTRFQLRGQRLAARWMRRRASLGQRSGLA